MCAVDNSGFDTPPPFRDVVAALDDALDLAVGVAGDPAVADCWSKPGAVEGYSVGEIAAHLYSAVRRLEVVLDQDVPEPQTMVGLSEFYGTNRIDERDDRLGEIHRLVHRDAEHRATFGPEATVERLSSLAARLRSRLPGESTDRVVAVMQVPNGVTRLTTYVMTRVVETVIHTDDLAVSVALPPIVVPRSSATVALTVLVELARARVGDLEALRSFARVERASPEALRAL